MAAMIEARCEFEVEAAPEVVFDYVADARNEPKWLPGAREITKTTEGPVRLGTRFAGTYARAGQVTVEVIEYERPKRLTLRGRSSIVSFDDVIDFNPTDTGGTALSARLSARPRGIMRLVTPLLARTMQRQFVANWPHLKRVLESDEASGSGEVA